ncbi:ABC transporter ATP-binding protein [Pseudohongiella spirulinae]|uniref:ABC transporter, ATP-binding protein n=1 Tax=Pseudohongiella spirulinae TaxID=1249552 RepID=A0A0S2KAP6_9GAMM|nr:ABC transporter ATP-binding protein [Pseudohongiella spirulinae]ALO45398.1 ABC transporter, ATP-binding protein [Pseudohongiella spirulinae]
MVLHTYTSSVSIKDLRFSWAPDSKDLLHIRDWHIGTGKRVFLYGPSGSGKTTLLNLICGIARPRAGEISVAGTRLTTLSASQRDRFRAQFIGVIFQQFNLVPYLSVADNIRLASAFTGQHQGADERATMLIEQLGLRGVQNNKASRISVGQQQRVAIARALLNAPPLIIADEPTSALDAAARDTFMSALLECSAEVGSTVLVVSHDHSLATYFDDSVDLRTLNLALGFNNGESSASVL